MNHLNSSAAYPTRHTESLENYYKIKSRNRTTNVSEWPVNVTLNVSVYGRPLTDVRGSVTLFQGGPTWLTKP